MPIGPAAPPPRRVTMPCGWDAAGLSAFQGLAQFTRKFGYPGKADPDIEHLWLMCEDCTGCREIRLNGQLVSAEACAAFAMDVTPILQDRNQLDVVLDGSCPRAGLWSEVVLEIRCDAYLTELEITRNSASVTIKGKATGVAPQPLDLYTLVDNRNRDYRTIVPTPLGETFVIILNDVPPGGQIARLELVHVSTVWYRVELPIPCWKS